MSRGPFYQEQTTWSYAHTAVPASVYISTRRPLLSLLIIYVFETLEALAAPAFDSLREQPEDSLIGDPIIGGMIIIALWLLDVATGGDVAFRATVAWWLRLAVLGVHALTVPLVMALRTATVNWGPLLYYAIYLAAALILYRRVLFGARRDSTERLAGQSVAVWLFIIFVHTLVVLPVIDGFSVWLRTFFTSLVFLAGAAVLFISLRVNGVHRLLI